MSTEHVGDREIAEPVRDHEQDPELEADASTGAGTRSGLQSPEQDIHTATHSRYPLNSRRLTAAHLRVLAEALGLPVAGSADQLRQCIEGKLQTEREDPNVVVIVKEVQTTGQILVLADAEGEFLETPPMRRGALTRPHRRTDDVDAISHELQEARIQLQEAELVIASARDKDQGQARRIAELQEVLRVQEEQITRRFEDEVSQLKQKIVAEKAKARKSWKTNCEHLAEQDAIITAKDEEIESLKDQLMELSRGIRREEEPAATTLRHPSGGLVEIPSRADSSLAEDRGSLTSRHVSLPPRESSDSTSRDTHSDRTDGPLTGVLAPISRPPLMSTSATTQPSVSTTAALTGDLATSEGSRRGKAPPIEFFSGESPTLLLEDWLPSLERAAQWNRWSVQDKLIQLPGYLKGRALQEWHLLSHTEQQSYPTAIEALRSRLDPRNKTMAAQEFRHLIQRQGESVAEFIRRLEKTYQVAYGKDALNPDTRDTLLYGQLYEGLRYDLMRGPAVSGSQNYRELCVAAKGEEHRLAALRQRQQFKPADSSPRPQNSSRGRPPMRDATQDQTPTQDRIPASTSSPIETQLRCYNCGQPGHLSRNCRQPKKESRGRSTGLPQVQTKTRALSSTQAPATPEDLLCSSSDEDSSSRTYSVRVTDNGSITQCVKVQLQGVPAYGLIDSGADITIVGGNLFKKVATIARLKRRDFRKADKTPHTYDQKTFELDGRMDLDISFDGKAMCTPVYIKMDAADQLLLSEGVCRQLGVITFHPNVERWRGGRKQPPQRRTEPSSRESSPSESQPLEPTQEGPMQEEHLSDARVPTIRVNLVQSVHLLPHQSQVVEVSVGCDGEIDKPLLLDTAPLDCEVDVDTALIQATVDGIALTVLSNSTGQSVSIGEGSTLGDATHVDIVETQHSEPEKSRTESTTAAIAPAAVSRVHSKPELWRKEELAKCVGPTDLLRPAQRQKLLSFLGKHHESFALEDHERGETDLIEFSVETGAAEPRRCAPRRMPFAVREEVARQLKHMQDARVIQPSASPWASPVVMVRKKDGSHRFCIDYRQLNAVTKSDTYPLPRIDDLLDQLGQCKYFSTLDLASGYWQIKVEPTSREKTAFVTPQGLYEFLVMPFGLTNAPAVFQRLMQRVLAGLNPEAGPDFVAVYIDDVLVFSRTMEEHLIHLQAVIKRIEEAGLKLKPAKCHFARQEVEYLGHLVTPEGLKTNKRLVEAVKEFPSPTDVRGVRRFLGLASYYRRFIDGFSKIVEPLRELTRKNTDFQWTEACDEAMTRLKNRLTTAPVLAYPSFDKPYTVETDASISGLGAVLMQMQGDSKLHPVAYASRSLTAAERNYSITELETLAVVWALTRFHSYIYGQSITVVTDHAAVKAVLETPNPSAKHARWWTRVYGAGLKDVRIVYRAGRLNASADALSRSPHGDAPTTGEGEQETQIAVVQTERLTGEQSTGSGAANIIEDLLALPPLHVPENRFADEQRKDAEIAEIVGFIETGDLPQEAKRARRLVLQKSLFTIEDGVLFYVDPKQDHCQRIVVPSHLREQILSEHHSGLMGGHFATKKTYGALTRHWWWDGMYHDTVRFTSNCPQCATVTGGGRHHRPPLHPIPVSRPFQIVGVDIMELPTTDSGNRYVLVFQDFLTKWPMVFPMPDQKSHRIAEFLVKEVVPQFGVPECLLSDRGTNLLSHLMTDVCKLLGIKKLNTTSHHPQCDGMIERFNRTLKTMLRKYACEFGAQWDKYLSGALWAYRNVPHDSTGEKPSFLLLGVDCRTPTEAALLPTHVVEATEVTDYREELVLSLSTARRLAAESIQAAQAKYKRSYDRHSREIDYQLGDWVLIRFPQEESGRMRKLSRPWHGPYRIIDRRDPDVTVVKVYAPQDGQIQVHQSRVAYCPPELPAGFYWYGKRRSSPGRPPRWVDRLLQGTIAPTVCGPEPDPARSEPALSHEESEPGPSDEPDQGVQEDSSSVPLQEADRDGPPDEGDRENNCPENEDQENEILDDGASEEANCNGEYGEPIVTQRRYGLRNRISPPTRLMFLHSSRSSLSEEGVM